jgi:hypothetical protein
VKHSLVCFFAAAFPACESPAPAPAVSASASGSPQGKAGQCAALLARVDRAVQESKKIDDSVGDGIKQIETLGSSAAAAKADIEKMAIDDPTVDAARDRYVAMLDATSKGAFQVAAAARDNDLNRLEQGNDAITKAVEQEDALIAAINKACGK